MTYDIGITTYLVTSLLLTHFSHIPTTTTIEMASFKSVLGGNHPQQQRNRQLTSAHKPTKCHVRLGSLIIVLISIYVIGLIAVVGWRQHVVITQDLHSENNDMKGTSFSTSKIDANQPWCHFEGNCPIGTTCVGHPSSPSGGICQAYRPSTRLDLTQPSSSSRRVGGADDTQLFNDCVSKCQLELEWDEHFYYDVLIPKHYNSMRALSADHQQRPRGCLIVFERITGRNQRLKNANREDWLAARSAQHVIRVDPLVEDTTSNMTSSPAGILWTALCYYPCQTDADCKSRYFRCDQNRGVCDRNPTYWLPANPQHNHSRTVLVTGANSGYWNGLVNFAASARFWAPRNPLVVYNLGLSEEQIKIVEGWSNVIAVEWKDGIPYRAPHVHQLKVYAWKPLAINESVHKYHNIFWLDAGATYTGPIDELEHYLQRTGIFLVKGQDESMFARAHENTFRYFRLDKETFMGGPHFAGGIQGHLFPSRYIDSIVKPNAECALIEDCISPAGASLANHRFDQTTLSILAYGRYHKIPHHTEFLAADSSQLHPDLSQPNSMFMWTARQGCSFYSDREGDKQQNVMPVRNNNNAGPTRQDREVLRSALSKLNHHRNDYHKMPFRNPRAGRLPHQ
jgi:hypothetical protein